MQRYEGNTNSYYNDRYNSNVIVHNSTTGQRETVKKRKKHISRAEKIRRRLLVCAACLVIGGVAADKIDDVVLRMEQNAVVSDQIGNFKLNVINEFTFRTENNKHYYRDYDKIANSLTEYGDDFSKNLYFTYASIGEEETNSVLANTEYKDLNTFLTENSYSSISDWTSSEKKEIILEYEIAEKQNELSKMQGEYTNLVTNGNSTDLGQYGGQK